MRRLAAACLAICLAAVAAAQDVPREVRVGFFVTSVSDIDPPDGSFRVSGYVWFVDPGSGLDVEEDIEILARSGGFEVFRRDRLEGGARYTAVRFDVLVGHAFDIRDYPFDRQTLRLAIEAAETADRLVLVPDTADSRIAAFAGQPGWEIGALRLSARTIAYDTGFGHRSGRPAFSRLTAEIPASRARSPLVFEKFAGFFVALVITALVLAVPVEEFGTRVGMTTSSVFAAVFNRYRLEDAIGFDAVFGVVDRVSVLTFSAILCVLGVSLLSHRLRVARGTAAARRTDRLLGLPILILHAALIGIAFRVALT